MFAHSKTESISNENVFFDFLKGILIATLTSLGLVVLFAFCLKWFSLPDVAITPATLAIKGVSVMLGALVAIKGESKGLLKGLLFGIIYIVIAFVVFSVLSGTFSFGVGSLLDLAFASLLGGIIGIIKVNKK